MSGKDTQTNWPKPVVSTEDKNLTQREVEVLHWAALGKTNAEIAIILSIKESTAKDYLERIGKKLNTTSKVYAVAIAVSRGLVKL